MPTTSSLRSLAQWLTRLPSNQVLQRRVSYLLTRPAGRLPRYVRHYYPSLDYQAQSWDRARPVVAKAELHPG